MQTAEIERSNEAAKRIQTTTVIQPTHHIPRPLADPWTILAITRIGQTPINSLASSLKSMTAHGDGERERGAGQGASYQTREPGP